MDDANQSPNREETYRRALQYGRSARSRYGADVTFDKLEKELASGWKEYAAGSGLSWEDARDAAHAGWQGQPDWNASKAGENVARQGGFDNPPTFAEEGDNIPRNRDEPNR